ncbi:MAG: cohesin domain-containing protein [Planctomycetota bacterium]|nr:cohesin domain-containing protein [Planctomycetota bacterium]
MRRLSFVFGLLLFSLGCSSSPKESGENESYAIKVEPSSVVITVVPEKGSFSAYTIELSFNSSVVEVDSVESGEFPGNPVWNKNLAEKGRIILAGFHTAPEMAQGPQTVAVVKFKPSSFGITEISARILSLYDSDLKPIGGSVKLSAETLTVR